MDGKATEFACLSTRSVGWIILFGAALFAVDFGPGWVLTYHEAYFAEPAREMLHTGDWLIPRVGGVPSWQKPPLTHWMIAATMGLLRTESEWAVRLPSLICTILNGLFIAALAARWYGDKVGRLAGLIQLSMFYALFQGRLAESDMPLCAAVSAAMLALAIGTIGRDRAGWGATLGFFVAAGLSTLIKGPFGLALIGGAAGSFALIERRWSVWRFLLNPVGLVVMTVLSLAWPIAAYRTDPSILDALRVHNVDRFMGSYDGRQGVMFYAYVIPGLLLPWTPFAIGGLIAVWRDQMRPGSLWRLLTCWMVVGLALISMSAWKHKHYPIPILPPLSIAAAYGLDRYVREARRSGRSPSAMLATVMKIAGVIVAAVAATRGATTVALVSALIAVAGMGLNLAFGLRRSGRDGGALAALFATIAVVVVLNESFVMPRYDLYRPHAEMARRTNARLAPGEVLDIVEIPHPQILFYLRFPFRRFDTTKEYAESLIGDQTHTIIGPKNVVAHLQRLGRAEVLDRADARTPTATVRLLPDPARIARARSGEVIR